MNKCLHCGDSTKYKFCSRVCDTSYKVNLRKQAWYDGNQKVHRPTLRKYLTEDRGYNCECCGISEWNNNPITLQVDHIDGNPSNNSPDNVRLICPNCHSQQDNWGARNKGSGRKSRGMPLF